MAGHLNTIDEEIAFISEHAILNEKKQWCVPGVADAKTEMEWIGALGDFNTKLAYALDPALAKQQDQHFISARDAKKALERAFDRAAAPENDAPKALDQDRDR